MSEETTEHAAPSTVIWTPLPTPLLGRLLVQTRGVAAWGVADPEDVENRARSIAEFIRVHALGLWHLTTLDSHDRAANAAAIATGGRILTSHLYVRADQEPARIWVLTEAEDDRGVRQSTCVMFPDDY